MAGQAIRQQRRRDRPNQKFTCLKKIEKLDKKDLSSTTIASFKLAIKVYQAVIKPTILKKTPIEQK